MELFLLGGKIVNLETIMYIEAQEGDIKPSDGPLGDRVYLIHLVDGSAVQISEKDLVAFQQAHHVYCPIVQIEVR